MKSSDTGISRPACVLAAACLLAAGSATADTAGFDHGDWTAVLERFVDEESRVDYSGLAADRERFDRYIEAVEAVSPRSHPDRFPTRDHELAYYINAYNAQVFRLVLERGPEKGSVWSGGLISGRKFFVKRTIRIGGRKFNLKGFEDDVIRGFGDPRIHAALNCASISCPRLRREAYLGPQLDRQLDAAMSEFVQDPDHVALDAAERVVRLSKIFDWFAEDFTGADPDDRDASLVEYVNRYRTDHPIPGTFEVRFLDYDKGLNGS